MRLAVTVVILNWNNPGDTLACLRSFAALNDSVRIVVVDNGSSDDSVARVRSDYPSVEIIETGVNLGYAGGNNVGIRRALALGAEAVLILNNDVIVEPGFIEPLLDALTQEPDIAVATPLVSEHTGAGDFVWALGSVVNRKSGIVSRLHAGERTETWHEAMPVPVDVASGAAMLIRREVFEQVGFMDEAFFLYYEETDWCLHIRRAGYAILAVPSSIVWHKVSATLGKSSPIVDYYMLRNHLRLLCLHWHRFDRLRVLAITVMRNLVTIAVYSLKSHGGRRNISRDARMLALRDAIVGRWGEMGSDVATALSATTIK